MEVRDALAALVLCGAVAVVTPFAATKFADPVESAAIAAALESEITFAGSFDLSPTDQFGPGEIPLCLESQVPLDIDAIGERFEGTILRLVPVSRCSSETVEGRVGMFASLTYYYDENGVEAGHLEIDDARCHTRLECIVDIDSRGSGNSYVVRRIGEDWVVTERSNRWVV